MPVLSSVSTDGAAAGPLSVSTSPCRYALYVLHEAAVAAWPEARAFDSCIPSVASADAASASTAAYGDATGAGGGGGGGGAGGGGGGGGGMLAGGGGSAAGTNLWSSGMVVTAAQLGSAGFHTRELGKTVPAPTSLPSSVVVTGPPSASLRST